MMEITLKGIIHKYNSFINNVFFFWLVSVFNNIIYNKCHIPYKNYVEIWLMLNAVLYYPNQSPSESLRDVYRIMFLSGSHVRRIKVMYKINKKRDTEKVECCCRKEQEVELKRDKVLSGSP